MNIQPIVPEHFLQAQMVEVCDAFEHGSFSAADCAS
jgi:hypothetical protein